MLSNKLILAVLIVAASPNKPTSSRTLLKKEDRFYVLEPSKAESLVSLATIDRPKVEEFARLGVTDMDSFLHKVLSLKK